MGERKWTDEQLCAINERSKTLLVSAAAGSGKTATLTERIIRSLTDEEHPISVESLLVVTFTKAATAELRVKLSNALEEALLANPNNKRLEHQLHMLPSARIRTIDSFCGDVLRSGADRVGVSPGYRIADPAENTILATSVIDGMISAVYSGEMEEIADAALFEALSDCLTGSKRTEELSEVLRYVYTICESSEKGVDVLLPLIAHYDTSDFSGVENTYHGSYLMEITREMLEHYLGVMKKQQRLLVGGSCAEAALSVNAENDAELLSRMLKKTTYVELRAEMMNYKFGKKSPVSGDQATALTEDFALVRSMMTEDVKSFAKFFLYTEEQWLQLLTRLHLLTGVLYRFEKRFDELLLEEKKRRGVFSYADVERLCYECLIKEGERTDIAENLRAQFDAIYIDEYQDVNSLQNSIFEAISRPDNRFMVGDIKQSIYGFRHARPEIFAKMKETYPPLSEATGSEASVFMSKNFRCDKGIVDFVNGIFDKAFSSVGESIGYTSLDRLDYAKIHKNGEPEYCKPQICMIDKQPKGCGDPTLAPRLVAEKIAELLDGGVLDSGASIRPSDIAIILRNTKGKDKLYAEALEQRGIPTVISGAKDFFLSPEVLLALCLLNSIDNPGRDIYLAGLMSSPLYSFDAEELYLIRTEGEGETLYASLCSYVALHPEFEKGREFLRALDYYRTIAEGIGVDTLIFKLYRETSLLSLAAKNGGEDNLMMLYDYARSYESGAYRGLYNFISFINNLLDKHTTFDDTRKGDSGADAVKIVTAHSSKGLEYPIVFLVNTDSAQSTDSTRPRLVLSPDFGVSFRLRTPSGLAVVESPVHDMVCHYIMSKGFEEELRVLYVALTRARERLYCIGTSTIEKREKYLQKIAVKRDTLSPYVVKELSSYLEIMLVCGESGVPCRMSDLVENPPRPVLEDEASEQEELLIIPYEESTDGELCDTLCQRFGFKYPNAQMTLLPEKMSVSRLSPNVLDGSDGVVMFEDVESKPQQPAFVSGRAAEESAKRGIATHYFLQFCDLDNLLQNGTAAELTRLVSEGYISQKDGDRVRKNEINAFLRSGLFADMRGAARLHRELRFNVHMPARLFTGEEDRRQDYVSSSVLVQGVIDCIVEYPDGSIGLFDYKTDRLTKEELADTSLAERTLYNKHSLQLAYYAVAVEKMFGKAPSRVEVYSLALGRCVDVRRKLPGEE